MGDDMAAGVERGAAVASIAGLRHIAAFGRAVRDATLKLP